MQWMAWIGEPWANSVTTSVTVSVGVRRQKGRTSALGEGLTTLSTDKAMLFVGMHADVTCARLPSVRIVPIRTECLCGVHDGSPLKRITCSVVEDAL
jgi:hypothetical protein